MRIRPHPSELPTPCFIVIASSLRSPYLKVEGEGKKGRGREGTLSEVASFVRLGMGPASDREAVLLFYRASDGTGSEPGRTTPESISLACSSKIRCILLCFPRRC
jgi:hypothetical protein